MRSILFLILMIFTAMSVSAADYYADIDIFVSPDGSVSFSGNTNHPALQVQTSQEYTSKKGIYWIVDISLNDTFSNYIYELHLPESSQINYIKTPQLSRIVDNSGITIIGTGEEQKFVVIAQYTITPLTKRSKAFYALAPIILLSILIFIYIKKKSKSKKTLYNINSMTDRQQQILKILEKHKEPITQAFLEKETGFPKSSLSRNIDSLVRKGVIEKQGKGMSNIISLKEEE